VFKHVVRDVFLVDPGSLSRPVCVFFGVVAVNIYLSVNQMIITSGQTNFTTGRIAVARGRLSVVRQVALVCTPT